MLVDAPELPLPTSSVPGKCWRVAFPHGEPRTYSADGFRVESGALVLLLPAGCVAAFAPGQWTTIQSDLGAVVPDDAE